MNIHITQKLKINMAVVQILYSVISAEINCDKKRNRRSSDFYNSWKQILHVCGIRRCTVVIALLSSTDLKKKKQFETRSLLMAV